MPVPQGRAHHVFRAGCASGTYFVKISGTPRPRLANERRALETLADRKIVAPEVVAEIDDALVTRSLGDDLRTIDADDVEAWRELGRWLRELHGIDASGLGLRYDTDPLSLGQRLSKSANRVIERHAVELPNVDERLAELEEACSESLPAFTHRDLRWDNVLVTQAGQFAGVVDFEHAARARAGWDFVKLFRWRAPSPSSRRAFVDRYGPLPPIDVWEWFEALMLLDHPLDNPAYKSRAHRVLGVSG